MRRFVVLALLLGLMALLQTFQVGSDTAFNPLSLATFGFMLLASFTLGQTAAGIQLPKITGYIVTGLVFGPQLLNVFSSAVEADLRVVNDLAIGLIALSAGAEMQFAGLKRIARSLFWIVTVQGLFILISVAAAVWGLSTFLPFLSGQPLGLILSVGMILGVIAIGTSPAATIAVISETGAKGRLADTTLGVAVAKDIVMVVLLALGIALTRTFAPDGHGFEAAILGDLAVELGLSLLAGAVLGAVIILYMRYVGAELWLFVVGIIFATTAIAHEFHLEALLVFIVAGFVVQNASVLGHDFVHMVERVALPVFVVFFSVAGAGLDLIALQSVLAVALALVGVRLLAIYVGTGIATRLADEPEPIRKNAWLSFVSQAGVAIGLSIIVDNSLPGLGAEIRTLVMATVAIHLLLGPVLFKVALTRVGEVQGADPDTSTPAFTPASTPTLTGSSLPPELEAPVAVMEETVLGALGDLTDALDRGPGDRIVVARDWTESQSEDGAAALAEDWAWDVIAAGDRFWATVRDATLAAPRQLTVGLEDRWFRDERLDTSSERWMKRLRRLRRGLGGLSGRGRGLQRVVPVRSMAIYHVDNALAEDLYPVVAECASGPAQALRDGLAPSDDEATPQPPSEPGPGLEDVVTRRFALLRRELALVGTSELRSTARRPSRLNERAERARTRTADAIRAWEALARAVVAHARRHAVIHDLTARVGADADSFEIELKKRFDDFALDPLSRARVVIESASGEIDELAGVGSEQVEEGLLSVGESVSRGIRRESLAGLRRAVETRPLNEFLTAFDDRVDELLQALPESFLVVDPTALTDPRKPPRTYPEPAQHAFRLIATGAVERTLRPTIKGFKQQGGEAIEMAAQAVHDVRQLLEGRFDAALDAAVDEGRKEMDGTGRTEMRESLQIPEGALQKSLSMIDDARVAVEGIRDEALRLFREDFDALTERLVDQLSSARALEARIQAERARVELHGHLVVRRMTRRLRRRFSGVLTRLGLDIESDEGPGGETRRKEREPFRPAGRAGSDRAVLFHILFDETTVQGNVFSGVLILAILASIVVLMLESVAVIRVQYGTPLLILEWLFTLLFTIEYVARLWVVQRPLKYALSFFGIIDLLAVLPTYLSLLIPGGQYLMGIRVLRVVRAFRVLKLARYIGEGQVLLNALRASRYKITVFLLAVLSVAVVMGSAMYLIEGPEAGFTSIPRGVYWSIVTLTTVGFGDITPQSPLGQTMAAMLMIMGYGVIAVPTGIVTAEIAAQPQGTGSAQSCARCGHVESNSTASYCSVCGTRL